MARFSMGVSFVFIVWLCSLGQLIKIIRQPQMETVVDKLIDFSGGTDEELRDISGLGSLFFYSISRAQHVPLALKTITAELPPDGKIAATACAKLTPKLLGQISNVRLSTGICGHPFYDYFLAIDPSRSPR